MDLRYAGTCKVCGSTLPAGARAYWDAAARTVTCWSLSCCEADGLTTRECHGPAGWVTERSPERVGASVVVTRLNSGATTFRNARGR